MSKLVNAVTHQAGKTVAARRPTRIKVDEQWVTMPYDTMREYHIGVRLAYKASVSEEEIAQSRNNVLKEVVAVAQRAIVEEVFGEFRPYFRDLEVALWEQDFDKARQVLRDFETQMFTADTETA